MRIVYLDQNKWIQLARVQHGKEKDRSLLAVLDFVVEAQRQGLLRFPLSMSHYLETRRTPDPGRRRRLATTMLQISGLDALAGLDPIVRFELERALRNRFPGRVTVRPFTLLGKGVGHVVNRPMGLRLADKHGPLTSEQREDFEARANALFQATALAGLDAFGLPTNAESELPEDETAQRFTETLNALPGKVEMLRELKGPQTIEERLRWMLYGQCLKDIRPVIEEVVRHHGIGEFMPTWDRPDGNLHEWGPLLEEVPSRRIDMHLLRQFALNANLKREPSDLNDVAYLGSAAAVCDILVCEKQMASILNRPELVKKAKVLRDLRDLPAA